MKQFNFLLEMFENLIFVVKVCHRPNWTLVFNALFLVPEWVMRLILLNWNLVKLNFWAEAVSTNPLSVHRRWIVFDRRSSWDFVWSWAFFQQVWISPVYHRLFFYNFTQEHGLSALQCGLARENVLLTKVLILCSFSFIFSNVYFQIEIVTCLGLFCFLL